jgi:hypothetical protein
MYIDVLHWWFEALIADRLLGYLMKIAYLIDAIGVSHTVKLFP